MQTPSRRALSAAPLLLLASLAATQCSPPASTTDASTTDATTTDAPDASGPAETVASLPITRTDRLMGLDGPVDVAVDRYGWPHVYASSLRDASFAQGYLTARDRMPQLELLRRLASGTLAESFGTLSPALIDQDIAMRVVGLRRTAERIWAQTMPGRGRTALEGYAAGVNAYLAQLRAGTARTANGTELVVNEETPDWTPVDSLTLGRYQVFSFTYEAEQDIALTALRDAARMAFEPGTTMPAPRRGFFWDFFRVDNVSDTAVIPGFYPPVMGLTHAPQEYTLAPRVARRVTDDSQGFLTAISRAAGYLGEARMRGSNNWVMPASSSATGHALLANDPHLALTAPSVWYGVHLTVRDGADAVDAAGVSFPGIPGVLIGFNRRVAWGATVAYYDVTDVYDETITAGAAGRPDTVRFNGADVPLQYIDETVGDGSGNNIPIRIEVVPHHGPVIPTIRDGRIVARTGTRALTVKWTGHNPTRELEAFVGAMYARSAAEARMAFTQNYGVGAMNWVFADTDGNALHGAPAVLPIRAIGALTFDPAMRADGTLPGLVLPGDGTAEWTGYVPPDRLPNAAAGPMRPFIASANNDQAGVTFDANPVNDPVYLASQYPDGFRAERVSARLRALGTRATREQFEEIQSDVHVLYAERYRPFIQRAVAKLEEEWARAGAQPSLTALATTLRPRQAALRDAAQRLMAWSLRAESGVGEGVTDAQRRDAVASSIFHAWSVAFVRKVFGDEMAAMRYAESAFASDGYRAALLLLEHPERARTRDPLTNESAVFDDLRTADLRESADGCIVAALDTALSELARVTSNSDASQWLWGNLHTVRFDSIVPGPGAILSIPPTNDPMFPRGFPRHGGLETVDASHPGLGDYSFGFSSGPSTRFTVDMDPAGPVAFMVLPGGQVFDTRSRHHRDEAELWRMNQSHRVPLLERDVAGAAEARVRLEPAR